MTSENHDLAKAVEIVNAIMKIASEPGFKEKLEKLKQATIQARKDAENGERHPDKEAKKGTCPTCQKTYTLKANGALRRHGTGKCYTHDQLPAELIPAVLSIALCGRSAEGESDGRAQDDPDS